MNNPTSSALLEQDGDVAQRRGELYPTRGDFIVTDLDRQDWLQVAYDIITHKGKKRGNIQIQILQEVITWLKKHMAGVLYADQD